MAIEQTAETGHDITLATHLAKNFDGYGEELKALVRNFVIESMSQPDGGYRRFHIDRLGDYVEDETDLYLEVTIDRLGDYVEDETDLYLEVTVAPYKVNVQGLMEIDMDSYVVFDRNTPRHGIREYYSPDTPELDLIIEEHLDQSVECFNEIGESAMWELLHEMETGEEMQ